VLHDFPYDIHSYECVIPRLADRHEHGYMVAERGSSTVAPASQTTSISTLRDDIEHTEPTETPAVRSVTEAKRHAPSSCTLRLEPPPRSAR
jgi:hypothetical protein